MEFSTHLTYALLILANLLILIFARNSLSFLNILAIGFVLGIWVAHYIKSRE